MSRACPREQESRAAHRRGQVDASIAGHVLACPSCGPAVAIDRALASLARESEARPFPSAAVLRLEGELRREELRLARRAAVALALHAAAVGVGLALLVAVRLLETGSAPSAWTAGGAGSICALVVVGVSIWNLVRAAGESAATS